MIMIIDFCQIYETQTFKTSCFLCELVDRYRPTDVQTESVNYDYDHLIFAKFIRHRPLRPVFSSMSWLIATDIQMDRGNDDYDN